MELGKKSNFHETEESIKFFQVEECFGGRKKCGV